MSSTPTTTTGSGFRPTRCRLRPRLQPDRRFPYDLPIATTGSSFSVRPSHFSASIWCVQPHLYVVRRFYYTDSILHSVRFVSHLALPEGPTNLATVGNPQFGPWVVAEIFPFFTIQPDSTSWRSNRRLTGWCGGTNAELLVPDPFSQSISGRSSVRLSQEMTR